MFEMPMDAEIDIQSYEHFMNERREIYLDMSKIASEVESLGKKIKSRKEQIVYLMFSTLKRWIWEFSKSDIVDYFILNGVPDNMLFKKATGRETLAKPVLQKIYDLGFCTDFILLYIDYNSLKYYMSKIKILISRLHCKSKVKGNDGEDLTVVNFDIARTYNRRYSTSNENVIGFYGGIRSGMKAKDGYLLVSGDFPQIDGKSALYLYFKTALVLDMISKTDDSYLVYKELVRHVQNMHDKYQLERILGSSEPRSTRELEQRIQHFDPSILPFENKGIRDVYKVITLKTVYNSRVRLRIAMDLANSIESIGRYRAIKEYIEFFYRIGYPIVVKSRFGYERVITERGLFETKSRAFNSPIQTTSSEIIIAYTVEIIKEFRSRGYGIDDIRLYLNRHDEPILEVKRDVFEANAKIFSDMSRILVHGWYPFKIDWLVGTAYKQRDSYLESQITQYQQDDAGIMERAKQFISMEEPLTLCFPEIFTLTWRVLPDGHTIFAVTHLLGDILADAYYFDKYKDARDIEYSVIRVHSSDEISIEVVLQMIREIIKTDDENLEYLFCLNNSKYSSKLYDLGGRSVFVTGEYHSLVELNKVLIGSHICTNFSNIATEEDIQYNRYTKYYSSRLKKRRLKS
jgi:hypothetical protein